jgi:hypothetical protein
MRSHLWPAVLAACVHGLTAEQLQAAQVAVLAVVEQEAPQVCCCEDFQGCRVVTGLKLESQLVC